MLNVSKIFNITMQLKHVFETVIFWMI